MPQKYIVVNPDGLNVRSQMSTLNVLNIKRKMSNGEGFTVFEVYTQNGNQKWGRVSDNPGGLQQEFVCLSIGNREYARAEAPAPSAPIGAPPPNAGSAPHLEEGFRRLMDWARAVDAWARFMGFEGPLL
ncbi:MAG: hypothetical protein HY869_20985 [Chloroflexi bacterium]|nr:hypothetical protein [Chloroflexota bacterium]